jgi:hypothetical protein
MANQKQLSVTYEDIEIVYDESENVWRFTLRGRERSAESLAKAKEAIDKPVPADKAKPFQRVRAIHLNYSNTITLGEVTSIADGPSYRDKEVWFLSSKGDRSKKSASDIYADSSANMQLVAESQALYKEADALRKKAESTLKKMQHLKIVEPE